MLNRPAVVLLALAMTSSAAAAQTRPTIMITGYWPPTSFMIRDWSPIPAQNPEWIGGNWESRGYDVKAYFPEFPGLTGPNWGRGTGDFEVDYQDTAADWARITAEVRPIAIITFSRANTSVGWEMEPAAQRWRLSGEANPPGRTVAIYTSDYLAPLTPVGLPIASEPVGRVRESSLPMTQIVSKVGAQMPATAVAPFIANYDPNNLANGFDFGGGFLSGYISYLGMWYQDVHDPALDPVNPCYAAGHIHVGTNVTTANGEQAATITLRALIAHLDAVRSRCVADVDDGTGTGTRDLGVDVSDLIHFLNKFEVGAIAADLDDGSSTGTGDGGVDVSDLLYFLVRFEIGC
jgi:hypothetical protein